MKTRLTLVFFLMFGLAGCASMLTGGVPNPLTADKGINTDVQLAGTANMTKKKQLVEVAVDAQDHSTTTNNAQDQVINNMNVNWWLIGLLVFLGGMAIPTRSQAKMIKKLEEDLDYERARTNVTVEAAARQGQEPRQASLL